MSEYWKSTPKYWCKHCQVYVRDTKLEKANHEATAKHQGALKRFLRDLHRGHENEEREKERARREIERLNGVVSGTSSSWPYGGQQGSGGGAASSSSSSAAPTQAQRKTQREQLAELGVAMPDDFRPEMAMAGEWTVTSTRVVDDAPKRESAEEEKPETRATGVRKRETTEDDKEEEDAVQGLFKKPRRWGRDSRAMPQDEDADLDALLSGSIMAKPAAEEALSKEEPLKDEDVKDEPTKPEDGAVKEEPDTEPSGFTATLKTETIDSKPVKAEAPEEEPGPAPVLFKKRKAKTGMRQK